MAKFNSAGVLLWLTPSQVPAGPTDNRGAVVDNNGHVWALHLGNNVASKFDGATGAPLGTRPVGKNPYTYSDATGLGLLLSTPTGTWTVIQDGLFTGTEWNNIKINTEPEGNVRAGASIKVFARAADTVAALGAEIFVEVLGVLTPAGGNPGLFGRFIEVKAELKPDSSNNSPVLSDVIIEFKPPVFADTTAPGCTPSTCTE